MLTKSFGHAPYLLTAPGNLQRQGEGLLVAKGKPETVKAQVDIGHGEGRPHYARGGACR